VEVAAWVPLEDVLPDPTGPGQADRSGGREQQEQPRPARVLLEVALKLPDVCQVGEAAAATRRFMRAATGSRHSERNDRKNETPARHGFESTDR
jgi:hypothetical protein